MPWSQQRALALLALRFCGQARGSRWTEPDSALLVASWNCPAQENRSRSGTEYHKMTVINVIHNVSASYVMDDCCTVGRFQSEIVGHRTSMRIHADSPFHQNPLQAMCAPWRRSVRMSWLHRSHLQRGRGHCPRLPASVRRNGPRRRVLTESLMHSARLHRKGEFHQSSESVWLHFIELLAVRAIKLLETLGNTSCKWSFGSGIPGNCSKSMSLPKLSAVMVRLLAASATPEAGLPACRCQCNS